MIMKVADAQSISNKYHQQRSGLSRTSFYRYVLAFLSLVLCGNFENVGSGSAESPRSDYPNVALGEHTAHGPTQYLSASKYGSHLAVDGSFSTDGTLCTHTNSHDITWWLVDLGKLYLIHGAAILNRKHYSGRTQNITIDVFSEDPRLFLPKFPEGFGHVCAKHPDKLARQTWTVFQCPSTLLGRYVRVVKYGFQHLTLCEVEVFASQKTVYKTFVRNTKDDTSISKDGDMLGAFSSVSLCALSVVSTRPEVNALDFNRDTGACAAVNANLSIW